MRLAKTLAGVHTHTHTHGTSIKINKAINNLNSKKLKNIILEDSFKKYAWACFLELSFCD